jgi:hypothetical protein
MGERDGAQPQPKVIFFGVWLADSSGHYRWDSEGRKVGYADSFEGREGGLYPWVFWRSLLVSQPEGLVWHWHHPDRPFTLLLSWDRSADMREGSCATFIIHAHVEPERELFPGVLERIEAHLGRPVGLAGPAGSGTPPKR